MARAFVRQMTIDSEAGQTSLSLVQEAIQNAEIEETEDNGNVNYKNRSLDESVGPLLKSLKLEVRIR